MKRILLLILSMVLVSCRLDPESLLGGNGDVHGATQDHTPLSPSGSTVTPAPCHEMELVPSSSESTAGCSTPLPLAFLLRKVESSGLFKMVMTFDPIVAEEFPKVTKVTYKAGAPLGETTSRALECRHITPVDDLPKMRVYECTLVRKSGETYTEHVFEGLELQNEKCPSKAGFTSRLKNECKPATYDQWYHYTVWFNNERLPKLFPTTN